MTQIELIGSPISNFVRTCRIALAEKGVPYTLTSVMAHSAEVNAVHPLGKIPAMRHGDVTLFESKAICFYIDRAFDGPKLIPDDPIAGGRIEQWISIHNTAVDPLWIRVYFREYVFPSGPNGTADRAAIDAALPKMAPQFAVLDQAVAATGHLVGANFTLADAYLLPTLHYMATVPESAALLDRSSNLKAYLARLGERQSVKDTAPPPFPSRARAA